MDSWKVANRMVFVSVTFMLIWMLFQTVIYSLRFKIIEPSLLFWVNGFRHLYPSSLVRIEGPRTFVKWRQCVLASVHVFSFEIFVQIYLGLHGVGDGVDVQNGREWTTTYVWTMWSLISLATCIFNVVCFVSLQNTFYNFVIQVLSSYLQIKWS